MTFLDSGRIWYKLKQTLQLVTNIYKLWQTYTNIDKLTQILTNIYKLWQTQKDRKQNFFYGDIEALADARRALKN